MTGMHHTVTRTIHAPVDAVWRVIGDPDHWADWLPTVTSVRRVEPDRDPEVGAAYALVQPGLPRATWVITSIEPGSSFTWESRSPGITSTGTHEVRPADDGTEVTLGIHWRGLLAPVVNAAYGRKAQRYIEQEALALAGQTEG